MTAPRRPETGRVGDGGDGPDVPASLSGQDRGRLTVMGVVLAMAGTLLADRGYLGEHAWLLGFGLLTVTAGLSTAAAAILYLPVAVTADTPRSVVWRAPLRVLAGGLALGVVIGTLAGLAGFDGPRGTAAVKAAGTAGTGCTTSPADRLTLVRGDTLGAGQTLRSPDGSYALTMLPTGSLQLCDTRDGSVFWTLGSTAGAGSPAELRSDGNFGIFPESLAGAATWATNTDDTAVDVVSVGDDGNVVASSSQDSVVWWQSAGEASVVGALAPQRADRLARGERLMTGEFLRSPNGQYRLELNPKGALVLSAADGGVAWASPVTGCTRAGLAMQRDGNLVLYANPTSTNPNNRAAMASSLGDGSPTRALVLRDDGSLVLDGWDDADLTARWESVGHCY